MNEVQTRCLDELIEAAWKIVEYAKSRVHDDSTKRLETALLQAERILPATTPTA
jgi:hypothetical protein